MIVEEQLISKGHVPKQDLIFALSSDQSKLSLQHEIYLNKPVYFEMISRYML